MPNYNIVADYSQFKPMDVSIPLSILREIAELNEKYRDKYNKIYEEEGRYVLPEGPYREALLKYLEDLSAAMDAFHNTHGSWESKIALNNMWKRHVTEMLPIKQMVENYNKGLETLYKMGPDAIVGNRELLLNLDSYYGGFLPLIDYRSKSLLLLIAAKTIQGLDNALTQAPDVAGRIANLYFILKSEGLNGKDALDEILKHNPDIKSEEGIEGTNQVIQALDNLYEQSKFKDGTPENEEVWQSIISGAIQGISAPKYSLQSDREHEFSAELATREYHESLKKHLDLQIEYEGYINDLKMGYVRDPNTNTKEYNPTKAKEILKNIREAEGKKSEDSTPSLPWVEYGGKRYIIKITETIPGSPNYEITDENKQIVTDQNLKQAIINKITGVETSESGRPLTERELKAKQKAEAEKAKKKAAAEAAKKLSLPDTLTTGSATATILS